MEIARKLADHPRFEPRTGMVLVNSDGLRLVVVAVDEMVHYAYPGSDVEDSPGGLFKRTWEGIRRDYVPDLEAWATVGPLLGMLAEVAPSGLKVELDDEEPALVMAWSDEDDNWRFARAAQPGAAVVLALLEAWA